MPSIERIERSGFAVWSPDETTKIAGWRVASSGGYTRRLNSATTIGSADTSLKTRDDIARWLADRCSPLTVRVTPLIEQTTIDVCAGTWGLDAVDETLVMVSRSLESSSDGDVIVLDAGDTGFTADLFSLNHRDVALRKPWSRIVERVGSDGVGLWIPGKAVGFAAFSGGIASVFSVAVSPKYRRMGFASRVMDAARGWALNRGADSMFLQVLGSNAPARDLYTGLGFTEEYRYHYLQPSHGGRSGS